MNEDRIVGAGRNLLGKAERGVGDAVDSNRLVGDGIVDQVAGSVQHGYGKAKDAVTDFADDAPGAVAGAVKQGKELAHDADEAIRERLGDNGPLYLLGGAIALFALGAFAFTRSSEAAATKPAPRRKPAKRAPTKR